MSSSATSTPSLKFSSGRFPARKLTVIGVTGTDGKTTTVSMVAHILQHAGIRVGALSTAFVQIRDSTEWNETQKTSPSPFLVQRFLRKLVREGCTHAVLEVSSHGLVQGRVNHTSPKVAAITNTSTEHLDYHGSIEQYRKDKSKLFTMLKGKGTKILNRDDATFKSYSEIPSDNSITYSLSSQANLWLTNISTTPTSCSAILFTNEQRGTLRHGSGQARNAEQLILPIPGSFNLENALCAIGCALVANVPLSTCIDALKSFRGAPGRMELIDEGQDFSVYVDFTVTPAAYEKTLMTLREMIEPGKRVLVLTGSCGDRMHEKRPIVGEICSRLADIICVTNEDPYTEDPEKIIDEVWKGIDQTQCEAHRISDRREAMEYLLSKAQPGDAVILCAKGSDTMMWTAQGQVPWNEREIARELLKQL